MHGTKAFVRRFQDLSFYLLRLRDNEEREGKEGEGERKVYSQQKNCSFRQLHPHPLLR